MNNTSDASASKEKKDAPVVPHFLSTVVTPLDKRVEMKGTGKLCSCWSFGN